MPSLPNGSVSLSESDKPTRHEVISALEAIQSNLDEIAEDLADYRENRRAIAIAITNLETAALWVGAAILDEPADE